MTDDKAKPVEIPVHSTVLDAPLYFADVLYHVTWLNGVARLSFVTNNADVNPDGGPLEGVSNFEGKHIVTIAMPAGSVIGMRDYLNSIIATWEEAFKQSAKP